MTTVRSAKAKGSAFEYDVQASLSVLYRDMYRTKERGFQSRVDLVSETFLVAIECKRWKGISWNQLKILYDDLDSRFKEYDCFVCFQCNRQPPLVMFRDRDGRYFICDFQGLFKVPFIKHESSRKRGMT